MSAQGVGARLVRKEDDRLMRGRGQFVADIRLPGMKDVAFVRSPVAHARIRGISVPAEHRGATFTAAELAGVKPIRAVSGLRGFKVSEQPPLATDKVRYVGELVAMCVGATRAEAEDIAQAVTLDLAELPAVHDMLEAREDRRCLGPRALGRQRVSRDLRRCRHQQGASMHRSRSRARSAPRGNAWRRSKGVALSPSGTRASSN